MKYARLIGIPYLKEDCWGIARLFYKLEFDLELKRYYDEVPNDIKKANNLIFTNAGDFERVTKPTFGTIILMNIHGIEAHIGIYLNEQQFLHSTKLSGCVVERLERWKDHVVGYYRVKEND